MQHKPCGCLFRLLATSCIGLGLLLLLARTAGPSLLRHALLSQPALAGLRIQAVEVRRLGFRELELGSLRLQGDHDLDALTIEQLHVRYRPDRLLRGEIDQVSVSSAALHLLVDSSGFQIPGAVPLPTGATAPQSFPRIGRIGVDNLRIICHRGPETWTLPASASVRWESAPARYQFQLQAGMAPATFLAVGWLDAISGHGQASLSVQDLPVAPLFQLAGQPDPLPFPVQTSAEVTTRLANFLPVAGQYSTSWTIPDAPAPFGWKGQWQRTPQGHWKFGGELLPARFDRMKLDGWHSALADVELWGGISASASALVDGPSIQTRASLTLDNLTFALKGQSTVLSNLAGTLVFTNLLAGITDGPQTVTFERVQKDALTITSGSVAFAIQEPDTVHLARADGNFCGGRLEIADIDLRADHKAIDGTLRCENILLAQMLNLTEWVAAEGPAALSGQLPFHVRGRQIEVENGFLETAPGQICRLRLREEFLLTRGLPPDNPGYLYASIAEEALKDFRCDWARADIRLVADKLSVALAVRGVPNQRLPFGYDVKKQAFFRTTPEKSNANFSNGITLTLRFNADSVEDLLYSAPALDMLLQDH